MKKLAIRLISMAAVWSVTASAFAQEAAATNENDVQVWKAIAAAVAIAVAAFGGALGQGKAAAAALEGIARNPNAADKMFVPLLLGLALIESLVIYALLIAGGFIGPLG